MSLPRMPRRASPARFLKLQALAQAAALLAGGAALAQDNKLERIEVTGSSIKRLEGETALPVQTLKREEIAKSGVTTAAELLKNISGNTAGLTDGASITDNQGGQRGFNGANLRGIGVSSTLILLNGRRMANFASPGDSSGVDLNNIPAGAIERVEILKDGASAIYGTDAIGGVINFITRKDYRGADINVYAARTQEGGAEKTTASVGGGVGNVRDDGFNLFGVLDVQKLGALNSQERDFIKQRPLADNLPLYLSSRTFPANIRLQGSSSSRRAQLAALKAAGYKVNGQDVTERTFNPAVPACNPPGTVFAPLNLSQACSFDYLQDTEIYPESEKLSLLSRGVLKLNADTELFAELLKSRATTKYINSPVPVQLLDVPVKVINGYLSNKLPLPDTQLMTLRLRADEAGNRSNTVTSDAERVVVGVSGVLGDWDYTTALNRAVNKTNDAYVDGYFLFDKMVAGVMNGSINPFGASPAAGKALWDSIRVRDDARKAKGITTTVDFKASSTLTELAGGALGVAVGAELRQEETSFTPSALLNSNLIAGDRGTSGDATGNFGGDPVRDRVVATSNSRKIGSVYGELNAPFTKELEVQVALRYDDYGGVGSTTNPKLGVRYQPSKQVMLRGSAGTGFRAPTISELYRPISYGSASASPTDPVCVKAGLSPADCSGQPPVTRYSNPNLKPERSKQASFGIVFEPTRSTTFSIDYWNIRKTDVISDIGIQTIINNQAKYGKLVTRDEFGEVITNIDLRKENQGELKTSGLDLEANWRSDSTEFGRFGLNLSGTYVLEYKRQFGAGEPFVSNVGRFLNDQVIQRWRHRASIDWDMGPFGLTLGNTFYSSYADQSTIFNPVTNKQAEPRTVKAYSLFDLSGSWKVDKSMRVRVGIQNLLDTQPPFSNQDQYFLATYDPTYTDPRGRTFYASISYSFR
ncbi:MAG: TonB-dependent receptor [Roseateles asaccharophilus]|uniref:Iron complex outermembrane receptor protein n=1 Tax=Roseateles asaccharophilus TaxID=582607 RepID=A0A4R6NB61_9BURK|nr:TonB-dependent receptor [Roseateles asaccharophilus]MDN3543748.1 TonB-dependent receptor [Roseateles asaccharophilus]TDP11874.1 iron complex outermembrane receptor protein [Roseateles asaccharophilus]